MPVYRVRKSSNFDGIKAGGNAPDTAGINVSSLDNNPYFSADGSTVKALGGLVDVSQNASGTVQNTEYALNSVTIKAGTFTDSRAVMVEAWGTLAANANAKNIKIYFGATAVATVTGSTANAKDFYATMTVVRRASNSQSAVGFIQVDTGTSGTMAVNGAITETDTSDIIVALKTANTAAAAASGTGKGMVASFL